MVKKTSKNNIVKLPRNRTVEKAVKENDAKYGKKVMENGYTMVPSILLRAQGRLGLSPTHLTILLQLMEYWWYKDNPARPSQKSLAERTGMKVRTLQRHLKVLKDGGFITIEERHHPGHNGNQPNIYHLDGLVAKLKKLEPEFTEQRKRAIAEKEALEKKNYKLLKSLQSAGG